MVQHRSRQIHWGGRRDLLNDQLSLSQAHFALLGWNYESKEAVWRAMLLSQA
jgi:hypothetical protein